MDFRRNNKGGGRMTSRISQTVLANRDKKKKNTGSKGGGGRRRGGDGGNDSNNKRWEKDKHAQQQQGKKGQGTQTRVALFISGFADTTREALESFLQRHTRKHFTCSKFEFEGVGARMVVANYNQAKALLNLNGVKYENDILSIKIVNDESIFKGGAQSAGGRLTPEQDTIVKQVLAQRYNEQAKMLNLHMLHQDSTLLSNGIKIDLNRRPTLHLIFKTIKANIPQVLTIDFSSNELRSLNNFTQLHTFAPNMINLNFENNKIPDIKELDVLKPIKALNELVLAGNPAKLKAGESYRGDICRKFPALQMLDGEKIETIQFAVAPVETVTIVPEEFGNFVNGGIEQLVNDFLRVYFDFYDGNRNMLMNAYADIACFSLVALKNPSRPGGKENPVGKYIHHSRNLYDFGGVRDESAAMKKRIESLYQGKNAIVQAITRLPETRHFVEDFCVDSWELTSPTTLMVFIHGTFAEVDKNIESNRSFDRTFFLTHAAKDSIEEKNGWPLVITNDQLTIRSFTSKYYTPEKKLKQLQSPQPATSNVNINTPSPLDPRTQVIAQLSQQTGMNYPFSARCLEDNGWNLEAAYQRFLQLKAENNIPPEAYMPM